MYMLSVRKIACPIFDSFFAISFAGVAHLPEDFFNDCDPNLTAGIARKLQNVQHDSNMAVSAKSITEIMSKLECAKSAGPDGISAECFKFSDTKIHVLLSLLFSMCLSHGYLPSALIKTRIVPIVKNKAGDLSDSNNY